MKIEYNVGDHVMALHPNGNYTVKGCIVEIKPATEYARPVYFIEGIDGEKFKIGVSITFLLCKLNQ